jgi:hypothetical protein
MNLNIIYKQIMAAFFLMLPLISFGQLPNSNKISHYNAEKVVPQSPEVASLSRYGKYPVNYSSGLVDIEISFDVLEGNSHRICNWINILQVPENIILGNGTVSMNVL